MADVRRLLFPPEPQRSGERGVREWLEPGTEAITEHFRPETRELVEWSRMEAGPVARLVTGPGGQGKTWLARRVCATLTESDGWLAGFVRPPAGQAQTLGADRWQDLRSALRALPSLKLTGTLLVVDYGEGNPAFARRLINATIELAAAGVRILVLARDEPDWWESVADEQHSTGMVEPVPLRLRSLPESLAEGAGDISATTRKLWTSAVREFAAQLPAHPGRPSTSELEAHAPEAVATTLDLYASALLTALGEDQNHDEDLISSVLRHDRKVFTAGATALGVTNSRSQELPILTAILCPADSVTTATGLLGRVPGLRQLSDKTRYDLAELLCTAYPAEDANRVWAPPRPDRLAETHVLAVAQRCRADADWAEYVLAVGATNHMRDAEHTAWVLVRALSAPGADRWYPVGLRRVGEGIEALARAHAAVFVPALVRFAPARFSPTLVELMAALPVEAVRGIDAELRATGFSTAQLDIAVAVSRRLVRAAADDRARAEALLHLGIRLAQAGAGDQALDTARSPWPGPPMPVPVCWRPP